MLSHKYINRRRCVENWVNLGRIKGCSHVWKGIKEGEVVFKKTQNELQVKRATYLSGLISGSIKGLYESSLTAL